MGDLNDFFMKLISIAIGKKSTWVRWLMIIVIAAFMVYWKLNSTPEKSAAEMMRSFHQQEENKQGNSLRRQP